MSECHFSILKCQNFVFHILLFHLVKQKTWHFLLFRRLVKGLESEKVRWSGSVESLQIKKQTLSGDVLLTAAFVSYLGYFTKSYRYELLNKEWLPFLKKQKIMIPLTEGILIFLSFVQHVPFRKTSFPFHQANLTFRQILK